MIENHQKAAIASLIRHEDCYDLLTALRGPDFFFAEPFFNAVLEDGVLVYDEKGDRKRGRAIEVQGAVFPVRFTPGTLKSATTGILRYVCGMYRGANAIVVEHDREEYRQIRIKLQEIVDNPINYLVPRGLNHFFNHTYKAFEVVGLKMFEVNDLQKLRFPF
jgi:hypothetical protein